VGNLDAAILVVDSMLAGGIANREHREELEQRRFELILERDLRILDQGIALYREREGRLPATLAELAGSTLRALPVAPAGSDWVYDPATGEVRSSLQEKRLRYRRPEEIDALEQKKSEAQVTP
jgi:hypothetical protein